MRKFLLASAILVINALTGCLPYATASGELGHKFNALSFQTVMGWWNTYRFVQHDDGLTIETRSDDPPIFGQMLHLRLYGHRFNPSDDQRFWNSVERQYHEQGIA